MQTLYEWFAHSADRNLDRVALETPDAVLTYRELRRAVDELAVRLRRAGIAPGDRVGLAALRDAWTYAGYLAVLQAGATVVPLNTAFPVERNRVVGSLAGLRGVLRDGTFSVCRPPSSDSGEVAYLLFTSGSTGTPKGVPIRHANVLPYLAYNLARYAVGPGDRLTQTFDLTFDPSVFDMFVTWGAGATLVVPTPAEIRNPVEFVNERGITHWFSVPSVISLTRRMRRLLPGCMPGLRWSLFAGEQLTIEQAEAWGRAAAASRIENLYGPTELTITCTGYRLPADTTKWPRTDHGTVPIGYCHPHLEHVVLEPSGGPGGEGDLCVRGPQRFDGYLDPADNTGRFVRFDPSDGQPARVVEGTRVTPDLWYRTGDRVRVIGDGALVHLGRSDTQVQLHGYRVELGEVEAALRRHPKVDEAVVLADEEELCAVYSGDASSGSGELADWLHLRLPSYMIPHRYVCLDALPLNPNGKIDRRKLEAMRV